MSGEAERARADEERAKEALAAIRGRYLPRALAMLDGIEELASSLLAGDPDPGRREQAYLDAHKLSGSMGTFGLPEGSRLAGRLEAALEPGRLLDADRGREIADLAARLRRELRDAGSLE
ncbi:MAG: hypothetical protein QOD86_910 [Miltoncostaeaceae bacterium]|nr:hypothetical protein [Miltoncostaeaceae bacterium]